MMVETVDPAVGVVESEGGMGEFLTAFANWTSCLRPSSLFLRACLNSLGNILCRSDGIVSLGSRTLRRVL